MFFVYALELNRSHETFSVTDTKLPRGEKQSLSSWELVSGFNEKRDLATSNNQPLPQLNETKYLGMQLELDRRLTWLKHIANGNNLV